jgi:BirA family transcriptional regulator, biotin operon repressor / biotin---[acetyl-CoA-carboxylase] ligase
MAVSIPSGVDHRSLLVLLADGRLHSGVRLARELGVRTGAVRRGIERLRALGVDVKALAGRGYGLPEPVELLDSRQIRAALTKERESQVRCLELLFDVDSTNTHLLGRPAPPEGSTDVCLSELQHAGRGRHGRRWIAPFGDSIALSLGWTFRDAARASPSLSLAVGVAISRALRRVGARGISLKWPNDVWFEDRKIGGVLIELRGDAGGPAQVVIGVGLNVSLSAAARRAFEASGVRVAAVTDAGPEGLSRNRLAGVLLEELLGMLGQFEREGFAPFRDAWTALDALRGRAGQVLVGDSAISGTGRGVDADGALLLESGGRVQRFVSGEVSLRLTEGDA